MGEQLLGLLECPYRSGWIEFEFSAGDRVENLKRSIEAKWGGLREDEPHRMSPGSWAIFCKQQDGSYRALKTKDLIPTSPPTVSETEIVHGGYFSRGMLDVFRLRRYWTFSDDSGVPIDPKVNYSMQLDFARKYKLPTEKHYTVTLLALVALHGG